MTLDLLGFLILCALMCLAPMLGCLVERWWDR